MKQVYQCDYCSEIDSNENTMVEHEKECSFNPDNRSCYSCGGHETGTHTISGRLETCYAGVNGTTMQDIQDEKKPCPKWRY